MLYSSKSPASSRSDSNAIQRLSSDSGRGEKGTRSASSQASVTWTAIAMQAMVLFGVPPEEYYAYKPADLDKDPGAFVFAFAQNYQALQYYRYDAPGTATADLLARIKTNLAAALPAMFGFVVYSSITQAAQTGKIPYPVSGEKRVGGHAVMAVGYDDHVKIKNNNPGAKETTGALLIRNSWGTGWGEQGYGWLPYEYVLKGLAVDWWSLLKNEWIDTGVFKA